MQREPSNTPRDLTAAGRERVVTALASGATIEAVRLYRQDTLASLADAKRAVDAMAAGAAPAAVAAPVSDDEAVAAALYAGHKIEAIKRYRLSHRVDLRTAKDAVEAVEADLRQSAPERFTSPAATGGCGPAAVIVGLIVLALVAIGYWATR